jgi:hypothetical protein
VLPSVDIGIILWINPEHRKMVSGIKYIIIIKIGDRLRFKELKIRCVEIESRRFLSLRLKKFKKDDYNIK